jgi:hypothetical protein
MERVRKSGGQNGGRNTEGVKSLEFLRTVILPLVLKKYGKWTESIWKESMAVLKD